MIIKAPNKILTSRAKTVTKINKRVKQVVKKLKKALQGADKPKGVGLAAPQIGIPLRVFIIKPTIDSPIRIFINPQIIHQSRSKKYLNRDKKAVKTPQQENKLEGCLSVPNIWGKLKRSDRVRLCYMDINGDTKEEEFTGFLATIVQHETDHVNGILFTQRVLEQREKLYRIEKDEKGEEKLTEIKV